MSGKRRAESAKYTVLRRQFLKDRPFCEVALPECTQLAEEVHHMAKRGKNYLVTETWLPVCHGCHRWIHGHPAWAREKGFLK